MRLASLLVFPVAAVLLVGACKSSASPAETTQPPPPSPVVTASVQTGIAPVDRFLRLVAVDDLDTIAADAAFKRMVCQGGTTYIPDAPMLPCSGTDAAGTIADAIVRGCAPHTAIRQEDLRQEIDWLADDSLKLEAVYEVKVVDPRWYLDPAAQAASPLMPDFGLQFSGGSGSQQSGGGYSVVFLTEAGALSAYDDCDEDIASPGRATKLWP